MNWYRFLASATPHELDRTQCVPSITWVLVHCDYPVTQLCVLIGPKTSLNQFNWLQNTQTKKSQSDFIRCKGLETSSITSELSLIFSNRLQEKGLKTTNSLAFSGVRKDSIVLNITKHWQMKKNLTSGCCSSFSFSTGLIRSASLAYKIYKRHKLSRVTSTMFTFSITSP